jgi:hypothetical protein
MFQSITEETIKAWKDKYGQDNVIALNIADGKIYFKKPTTSQNYFHIAKRAIIHQQQNDLLTAGEIVFNECYLGGLGERADINIDSSVFVNACFRCADLIEVLEGNFTTA